MSSLLQSEITQLIESKVDTTQFEVDSVKVISRRKSILISVLMDKNTGGITIDECANWNRQIADWIEEKNLIQGTYLVEVSSPGLDRSLKTEKDFRRAVAQQLSLHYRSDDGRVLQAHGKLVEASPSQIEVEDVKTKEHQTILIENIVSAKVDLKVK